MVARRCLLFLFFVLVPSVSLAGNIDIEGSLTIGGENPPPEGTVVQLICEHEGPEIRKNLRVDEEGRFSFQVPEESVCQTRVELSEDDYSTVESIYFAEESELLGLDLEQQKDGEWYLTSKVE